MILVIKQRILDEIDMNRGESFRQRIRWAQLNLRDGSIGSVYYLSFMEHFEHTELDYINERSGFR